MARVRAPIVVALLAGPVALAFFSGGYFDRARLWAALLAWCAVAVAAVAVPRPLPRTIAAWSAIAGLLGLAAWNAASISWSPVAGVAQADAERLLLYLGVLVAAIALLRPRAAARAYEPIIALGGMLVICEGLSERVLPGIFTLAHTAAPLTNNGRLEQPLTYWNAVGFFAAMAAIIGIRVAGDSTRPAVTRILAAAATPALLVGMYLSLSRAAALAFGIGVVALVLFEPTRAQLRALVGLGVAGLPGVAVCVHYWELRTLQGTLSQREHEGLILLAALALGTAIAVAATAWAASRRAAPPMRWLRVMAQLGVVAMTAVVVIVLATTYATTHTAIVNEQLGAANARLTSVESNRGDFWQVAVHAFEHHPVRGLGAGGYRVAWLSERRINYNVNDAHSLYLQTLAELGLVGGAALIALFAGVFFAARAARRSDPNLCVGPIAVLAMWAVHAALDWDWEMPALTLVAMLAAGVVVACAERSKQSGEEQPVGAVPAASGAAA